MIIEEQQENSISINHQASVFYSNLSAIIKATTIPSLMTKSAANAEINHTAEFYLENDLDYPVQAKLATIDIETEEGNIISFYDLSEEEQVPPLEKYIEAQNEIVAEVLEDNSIDTKARNLQIDNPKSFFAELSARITAMSTTFEYDADLIDTKGMSYSFGEFEVEFNKVRNLIANKAKRGDIIVALPCHEYPRSLIDFGNKKYKVGHAEIFTKNITTSTSKDDYSTIGAWTEDGVSRQTLANWCWKSYVVGVCSYKIKWKWRGLKSWFYPVQTPVPNPSLLATWAEKYEGKSYVKLYEFATPKWVAPDRFTCTSLVWWCAKKAYNEKISPWYSTLVTPSDVLCDNNTYIKVIIQ